MNKKRNILLVFEFAGRRFQKHAGKPVGGLYVVCAEEHVFKSFSCMHQWCSSSTTKCQNRELTSPSLNLIENLYSFSQSAASWLSSWYYRSVFLICELMELMNKVLNFVVPPASLIMLAFAWPTLYFISSCEWLYNSYFNAENMLNKVVLITGASSGIGEVNIYIPNYTFIYSLSLSQNSFSF